MGNNELKSFLQNVCTKPESLEDLRSLLTTPGAAIRWAGERGYHLTPEDVAELQQCDEEPRTTSSTRWQAAATHGRHPLLLQSPRIASLPGTQWHPPHPRSMATGCGWPDGIWASPSAVLEPWIACSPSALISRETAREPWRSIWERRAAMSICRSVSRHLPRPAAWRSSPCQINCAPFSPDGPRQRARSPASPASGLNSIWTGRSTGFLPRRSAPGCRGMPTWTGSSSPCCQPCTAGASAKPRPTWSGAATTRSLNSGVPLYVFGLLSRPGNPVRMEIYGRTRPARCPPAPRGPHTIPALAEIAPLFEGIERPHFSFDIATEILPRVGLEGSFPRQREPRWAGALHPSRRSRALHARADGGQPCLAGT